MFLDHTSTCAYDIRYEWWAKSKTWVVAISDSAGGPLEPMIDYAI
jgi:hypothetical protein